MTEISENQAAAIASLGGVITLIEDGTQNIEFMRLADDEIEALKCMPTEWQQRVIGRLVELTASLRESVYELEGRLVQLGRIAF